MEGGGGLITFFPDKKAYERGETYLRVGGGGGTQWRIYQWTDSNSILMHQNGVCDMIMAE